MPIYIRLLIDYTPPSRLCRPTSPTGEALKLFDKLKFDGLRVLFKDICVFCLLF